MKLRTAPAKYGTCHADGCVFVVVMSSLMLGEDPDGGRIRARAFCQDHCRERDLELSVRNASGGTAEVVRFDAWERGPYGRVRRRGYGNGIVD